ncbi:MAG: ATP-binding protein [Acidimicrobiia bacterium]
MVEQRFAPVPQAVPRARSFAAGLLRGVGADVADRVLLLVSELATNCVRHAGASFLLDVIVGSDSVRVAVTDSGDGAVTMRSPEATEPSGRGLRIVDALADEWGIEPAREGTGKTVWFSMRTTAADSARA